MHMLVTHCSLFLKAKVLTIEEVKMLPQTTKFIVEKDVFAIKNRFYFITVEEAMAIRNVIIDAINNPSITKIIIDNSEAEGVWPRNILECWQGLFTDVAKLNKKVVTLTNSHTAAIQFNRNAKAIGLESHSRGFCKASKEEMIAFLNV